MLNLNGNISGSNPLLSSKQVPPHFQERYILSGYRYHKSTPVECVRSIFDVHNETLNFWTHFLPALYFTWHLMALLDTHDFVNDRYSWPFFSFMITSCAYPLSSSIAHLFSTMSHRSRHICFFFDYAGLGFYGFGVSIAYRAYAFPDALLNTWYSSVFLYVSVAVCLTCMYITCQSRLLNRHSKVSKAMKITGFSLMYNWDSLPLLYRLIFCRGELHTESYWPYTIQFIFAALTVFLYASHIPERFFPGKFDVFGHSHMLFHMTSVIATNHQMNALLIDMETRKADILASGDVIPLSWSVGGLLFIAIANLFIIAAFVIYLYKNNPDHDD